MESIDVGADFFISVPVQNIPVEKATLPVLAFVNTILKCHFCVQKLRT